METTEQLCTFFLDDLLFGIEVLGVQEVVRDFPLTPVPLAPPVVRGLLNLRGQIVPALGLDDRPGTVPMNVVLRTPAGPVSLLVDRPGEVLEVARAEYERPPETLRGPAAELVRGAYKLDGRLLLVLDEARLTELTETRTPQP